MEIMPGFDIEPNSMPKLKEVKKLLAERYFSEFVKQSWNVIEPFTEYKHNWHIDLICEYLEAVELGQINRLLINIPPRYMKSILITVNYPIWCWIKKPHKRFISLSYSANISMKHNMNRRDIIQSSWYQDNWKNKFSLADDLNTKTKFGNNYQGFMFATSIGGTITGEGGDCLLAGTMVETNKGRKDIRKLVELMDTILPYKVPRADSKNSMSRYYPITRIKDRPKVLSLNCYNQQLEYKEIVSVRRVIRTGYAIVTTENGATVKATLTHRFLTCIQNNGFMTNKCNERAEFLKKGTKLGYYDKSSRKFKMTKIAKVEVIENVPNVVYDIQVQDNHNFFANGVLVHNCIIVDDPHSPKTVESEAERLTALEFFRTTLPTRLNDKKTGSIIVVMQRLHEQDISGHILQNEDYTHVCLPGEAMEKTTIYFPISKKQLIREDGELLWPEREDKKVIEQMKAALGSYGYSGQYQQNPSPIGGGVVKRHWWKFWKHKDQTLPQVTWRLEDGSIMSIEPVNLPDNFDDMMQSWDLTFKATADSDYVVGQVWGREKANKFLLDQIRKKMTFTESITAIRNLTDKWPKAYTKLVEDKANGSAAIDTLKNEIDGIIPINPVGDKESRISAVTPQIESGNFYLPHPLLYPWVMPFIETFSKFPKVAYDDECDCLSMYGIRAKRNMKYPGAWQYRKNIFMER